MLLTIFITPFGYHLPFGITSALKYFQREMSVSLMESKESYVKLMIP